MPESCRQGERFRMRDVPWLPLGRQFCPPSTAGSWPLGSCPSPGRTHGTWLVLAALRIALTHTHAHTGPLGTASLVCFVASWLFARALASTCPACWCLQSTTVLTARPLGAQISLWSLHWLRAPCRGCRWCGSATTPQNRPERPGRGSPPPSLSPTEANMALAVGLRGGGRQAMVSGRAPPRRRGRGLPRFAAAPDLTAAVRFRLPPGGGYLGHLHSPRHMEDAPGAGGVVPNPPHGTGVRGSRQSGPH